KLVLCMIVKNESRIIQRCINSCKDIIDAISICDTGSTDNTVELIEKMGAELKLPTKVWKHQWKNFGHNRSLSFTSCVEYINSLGWNLNQCYGLLLDADMNLVITPAFNKHKLNLSGYHMLQCNPSIEYFNTRIVRLDEPWECLGVTHEYWGIKDKN